MTCIDHRSPTIRKSGSKPDFGSLTLRPSLGGSVNRPEQEKSGFPAGHSVTNELWSATVTATIYGEYSIDAHFPEDIFECDSSMLPHACDSPSKMKLRHLTNAYGMIGGDWCWNHCYTTVVIATSGRNLPPVAMTTI